MKKQAGLWILLGYAVVGILAYGQVLGAYFLSDDFELLRQVAGGAQLSWFKGDFLRPLVMAGFSLDYSLWGMNPWGYHLGNLFFHTGCAFLVYLIALKIVALWDRTREKDRLLPALAGLLFLVFPGHSESVSWISGRTDLTAVFFCLLSFYCFLLFREKNNRLFWVISLSAFAAALMCKEAVLPYPFILAAFDFLVLERHKQGKLKFADIPLLSFFLMLAGYFIIRYALLGVLLGGYESRAWSPRLLLDNARKFLLRSFLPAGGYLFTLLKYKLDLLLYLGLAVFFYRRKQLRLFLFLFVGAIFSLVPVLNLDISLDYLFNERFVYFSSVFFAILTVPLLGQVQKWKTFRGLPLLLGAVIFLFPLYNINGSWARAGVVSEHILESFSACVKKGGIAETEPVFILNLPDNLEGAYIFRQGLSSALHLTRSRGRNNAMYCVATHGIHNIFDTGRLEVLGEGSFRLTLPGNRFLQTPVPSLPPYYRVEDSQPDRYGVTFGEDFGNALLLVYSAGYLNKVETAPPVPVDSSSQKQ